MQIGMVELGKMGAAMTVRLMGEAPKEATPIAGRLVDA